MNVISCFDMNTFINAAFEMKEKKTENCVAYEPLKK